MKRAILALSMLLSLPGCIWWGVGKLAKERGTDAPTTQARDHICCALTNCVGGSCWCAIDGAYCGPG